MADWQSIEVRYRSTGPNIDSRFSYDASDSARISDGRGQLVKGGIRRLSGIEGPMYWAGTATPAYLGVITTGNSILPIKVATNEPVDTDPVVRVKIGDETHGLRFAAVGHQTDEVNPNVHLYSGRILTPVTETIGFPSNEFLLHQVALTASNVDLYDMTGTIFDNLFGE